MTLPAGAAEASLAYILKRRIESKTSPCSFLGSLVETAVQIGQVNPRAVYAP
jgi:hypothetical protein